MKYRENFVPGWYNATNSKRFHWFENQEGPICGKYVKGFPEEKVKPGSRPIETDKANMTKYSGGCTACIAKLKKQIYE